MQILTNYFNTKKLFLILIITIFYQNNCYGDTNIRVSPVVKAVRKVSSSVVNISSEYEVLQRRNPFTGFGRNDAFNDFFKDFFDPYHRNSSKRINLGSGVIIDGKRGYILTNAHVIEKTGQITITLNDNREFIATVVGADPDSDLAVLKIDSEDSLPSVSMGNSDDIMIGETVIAIGNPFGFSNTVSTGVVSAVNRSVKSDNRIFKNFIQIDAPINPGNSGGPLLNIVGDLIGINTAIYANAQGIGFAIPINRAKQIIANLIKYGEVINAWTGLIVQDIDRDISDYLGIEQNKGILLSDLLPDSPAETSGLNKWDIIIEINKIKLNSVDDFNAVMADITAGEQISITVLRKGNRKIISMKTSAFPVTIAPDLAFKRLGIRVIEKSGETGVYISEISKHSYLYKIGVRPGDLIRQINESRITTTKDFNKAIVKYRQKQSMVILVIRNGYGYYITVQL